MRHQTTVPAAPHRWRPPRRRLNIAGPGALLGLLALLLLLPPSAVAQTRATAPKGFGPVTLATKRGKLVVHLLRRDKNLVWVNQQSTTGAFIETGLDVDEIQTFEIGRPRLFIAAEAAADAETREQAMAGLRKMIDQLKPFRDLPGMVVDEAQVLLAGLWEKQERFDKAAELYTEVMEQKYKSEWKDRAQLRLGLCLVRAGDPGKAIENLRLDLVSDDDLKLLSSVYQARGEAFRALGQPDESLLSYLQLVVFYPYVDRGEARGLAGALPAYAALGEWESAYRSARRLKERYPGSPEAAAAQEFIVQNATPLAATSEDLLTDNQTDNKEE
jgi:tetratricopeptide (TPR) repeat protein